MEVKERISQGSREKTFLLAAVEITVSETKNSVNGLNNRIEGPKERNGELRIE